MKPITALRFLKSPIRFTVILIFTVSVVFFTGCESLDEDSYSIEFYPDTYAPPDNSISLDALATDDKILYLVVKAANISNGRAHSVIFDIKFEPVVFRFAGYEPGSFFESGGQVGYQAGIDSQDPGRLVVAVSLLGSGSYAQGSGYAIRLKFEPLLTGDGYFQFENAVLLEELNGGFREITGISWFGGYSQVVL